jgi:hypothetical protein
MLKKSWPWLVTFAGMAVTWWWIGDSAARASQAKLVMSLFAGVSLTAMLIVLVIVARRPKARSGIERPQ